MEPPVINYIAVIVATVAGFAVGSVWYMVLGKQCMAALGKGSSEFKPSPEPFVISLVAQFVMAWVLAGSIGHLGVVTPRTGIITGLILWGGFVATTMVVNHTFQGASRMLTLIDAGHWLAVLMVMGLVIGLFGISASSPG